MEGCACWLMALRLQTGLPTPPGHWHHLGPQLRKPVWSKGARPWFRNSNSFWQVSNAGNQNWHQIIQQSSTPTPTYYHHCNTIFVFFFSDYEVETNLIQWLGLYEQQAIGNPSIVSSAFYVYERFGIILDKWLLKPPTPLITYVSIWKGMSSDYTVASPLTSPAQTQGPSPEIDARVRTRKEWLPTWTQLPNMTKHLFYSIDSKMLA